MQAGLLPCRADSRLKVIRISAPVWPAARPKPPLSIGSTLRSPLLFPGQFPLLAQPYLEEHQEHSCAKTEGDQRDGEHFAGQAPDQGGAKRTGDYERRGRSECEDARAGRHRPTLSLRTSRSARAARRSDSADQRMTFDACWRESPATSVSRTSAFDTAGRSDRDD
jgi:hypothetical protein